MTPLVIRAHLSGSIALPNGPLALDALLASQVALRLELPPPRHAGDCQPIEIPIEKEPRGRFHLCSFSVGNFEARYLRYVNRRAPVEQYQTIGEAKIRRVQITSGANKSYRIPLEAGHVESDVLTWWCVGDAGQIRELLSTVLYVGKKRAVGLGRVDRWEIEPCEPWDGFPVLCDGRPLRPLPTNWPGLDAPRTAFRHVDISVLGSFARAAVRVPVTATIEDSESSAKGRWFITPHGVRRYIERCPGARRLTYEQALGRLIDESTKAHFVKARRNEGEELWRGGKPHRLRFVVCRANAGLPQLVTVLRGCDAHRE